MLRATLAALLLAAAPAWAQDIGVHDPYALSAVPSAPTAAAYMLIHNHGSEPDRLVGARSPAAEAIELHTSEEDENGVVRMRPVEGGLELRADSVLLLNRGGPHLMMTGLTGPLEDRAVIPMTLIFETAGEITIDVPVDRSRLTETAGSHDHGAAADGHDHGEAEGHGPEDEHAGH
jgi:copper(I)-binding protein